MIGWGRAEGNDVDEAKYQLVVLGGRRADWAAPLVELVRRRLAEIGEDLEDALKVLGPENLTELVRTSPAMAVYLGCDQATHAAQVSDLMEAAVPVIPVVEDLERYRDDTPEVLHPVNGVAIGKAPDFGELANLVLENLSLLRRSRRLFISYLRKESTPAAHQLRVAFDDAGYDAFLDTSSVPKGDDFQAVLWHRLLDSDVMVVLDTENFLESRWTVKELAEASAMAVGLLRVVWPGVKPVRGAELAEHLYLSAEDLDGGELTAEAAGRVLRAVDALRARCIAARYTNLVVEFCEEAHKAGASTAVQPGRYVLASMADGRRIAVVPAVGVPDAQRYHEASARFPLSGQLADEAVLIYDHRGMLPAWTGFLDWLDDYLPVRGLRVTETAAKLGVVR